MVLITPEQVVLEQSVRKQNQAGGELRNALASLAMLQEYQSLKSEQAKRLEFREHLTLTTATGVGAIVAVALGLGAAQSGPGSIDIVSVVLVLPFWTAFVGWVYLHNEHRISEIRHYVKDYLKPAITTATLACGHGHSCWEPLFHWEERMCDKRAHDRILNLCIELFLFVGTGVVGLLYWMHSSKAVSRPWLHVIVPSCEGLLLGWLAFEFVRHFVGSRKPLPIARP